MRTGTKLAVFLLFAAAAIFGMALLRHGDGETPSKGSAPMKTRGTVNAPDFPAGMQWLNTDHPVSLKDLRGKVVVLDFWTFCCINCMHVLPDLKKLEHKYPNELVVVGVHSAKFTAEQSVDNIREAILRYDIEHPVVNDKDMAVWESFGVRAWPTLFVIDPDGKVVGYLSGEGIYEPFDQLVGAIVKDFDAQGKMNRAPLKWRIEKSLAAKTTLDFPGKVLADEKSSRLFISDSNHHRILVASLPDVAQPPSAGAVSSASPQARAPVPHEARVTEIIGSGELGLKDGSFAEARFNKPQGLALAGDALYVADTENHAVRKVDLAKRTVTTLVGTGEQARGIYRTGTMEKGLALNSPWDLVVVDGKLYVAMAGPHQIWAIAPETGASGPWAGSGREGRYDGPLDDAALAQPSGITTDGRTLYWADSEVSSIRSAGLGAGAKVATIVGRDLFEFGDKDGVGDAVRLQHPLGVALHDGKLYVADTYNNKVKLLDPATRRCDTFLGSGKPGLKDGPAAEAQFNEPGGLSVAGGRLYVADTNNNVIRVADLKTKAVTTLTLTGLAP